MCSSCFNYKRHLFDFYDAVGKEFSVIQKEVNEILDGRILVGHSIKNDLTVVHVFCSTNVLLMSGHIKLLT